MDFTQLKQRTENIQQRASELLKNYKDIYESLIYIYNILSSRIGENQLRSLDNLINEYFDVANDIRYAYGDGADGLIRYINRTQENLDQLNSNLKAINNMLKTAVESIQ